MLVDMSGHRAPGTRRNLRVLTIIVWTIAAGMVAGLAWIVVQPKPDPEACTTALIKVGLANIDKGTPAAGQPRPDECSGLTETQYATAVHDASLRIIAVMAGH
jgi:hypothetical protein